MSGRAGVDLGRWIGVAALVLVAAAFSFLNAGERVSLNVGFAMLYRISLVGLVFGAFLMGMIAMFLFGLHHDRRIRAALREPTFLAPPADRHLADRYSDGGSRADREPADRPPADLPPAGREPTGRPPTDQHPTDRYSADRSPSHGHPADREPDSPYPTGRQPADPTG